MSNDTQVAALTALAKECGAITYTHRSNPHEAAVSFGPAAWEKFVEASARQLSEHAAPIMTITGYQLREALEFLAPDGEAEQLEQSVCIQHGPERTHDEGTDPAGLYCWLDDCPEEGSIALTGDDARIIEATRPQQAGPGFVMVPVEPTQAMLDAGQAEFRSYSLRHMFGHPAVWAAMLAARPLTAAPIPEASVADEREAFEAWYFDRFCFPPSKVAKGSYSGGKYYSLMETELLFEAWKAARTQKGKA